MTTERPVKSGSTTRWPPSFRFGVRSVVGFVLAFAAWVTLSATTFHWAFGDDSPLLVRGLWNVPSGLVQIGIVSAVLRYEDVELGSIGASRRLLWPAVVATVGVVVAVNAAAVGLATLAGNQISVGPYAFYRSAPYDLSPTAIAVTALASYVFVGPIEELAFRGYLQNKLISLFEFGSVRLRTALGVVATGVLFSALHIPVRILVYGMQASQLAATLVVLALSGVVFGAVYALTQNLYLVMFLHGVGDFWPFVVDPGTGVWPNYLVLFAIYLVLVVAYRQTAARTRIPTPTLARSD